jgi:DMSO/TMAO reductase YedYZ molybdopterin-dependent catalytic subunit
MKDQALELQAVTHDPFNAETPFPALKKTLTETDLFYIRNHFDVPRINAAQHQLKLNGAIDNPLEISIDKLKTFGASNKLVVMECAGNGRTRMTPSISGTPWNLGAVSQAEFTGTSLRNLLIETRPSNDAVEVKFTGADKGKIHTGEIKSYARSLPFDVAMHPDTMLVWEMNGQPLTDQHGFPLRLKVPGWYGMASVKWLQEITVLTQPFEGFFQSQEYVYVGEEGTFDNTPVTSMRVRSIILEPESGTKLEEDQIQITGIAWTGVGEITKIDLSFDEGQSWVATKLRPADSGYGMTRWEYVWRPDRKGTITIIARAYDSKGNEQPLESRWNKGGYGNNVSHRITISIS